MAKKRGPDGTPVDVPSNKPDAGKGRENADPHGKPDGGDIPTDHAERGSGSIFPEEPPTAPAGTPGHDRAPTPDREFTPPPHLEEPKTVIHGGHRRASRQQDANDAATRTGGPADDAMNDPVAGWVVIVEGPGAGRALQVGHGQNSIGRAPTERIALDFGDDEISRNNHAMLTYDTRGRRFFMQQGTGTNLVYVDDAPVLTPIELQNHAEILIGNTRMRFVAFCGPEFSWQDR